MAGDGEAGARLECCKGDAVVTGDIDKLDGLRAPLRCEGPRETMHNYFAYIII